MSTAPYFSVVIPTYNRRDLVVDAVGSVLRQSFDDFEILVIDNGSTDDTGERIGALSDPRIRYVWREGSGSPAAPRNQGLRLATGEWVAFLDSDDLWKPNKLEIVARAARSGAYQAVSHWQGITDLAGNYRCTVRTDFSGPVDYKRFLLAENTLVTSGVAVERRFLTRHNLFFSERDDFIAVEDHDLWLRILQQGGRFGFVRQVLGVSREHGGHTGSSELFFRNHAALVCEHALNVQRFTAGREKLRDRLLAGLAMRRAMTAMRARSVSTVREHLVEAFRLDPAEPLRYAVYRIRRRVEWLFLARRVNMPV